MSPVHLRPPFRAEHVGSLLRPKPLLEKRQALEAKKCALSDLKPVEDEAIKDVVKLQQDIGIKTITDGEFRRFVVRNLHLYLLTQSTFLGATSSTVYSTSSKAWYTCQIVRFFFVSLGSYLPLVT